MLYLFFEASLPIVLRIEAQFLLCLCDVQQSTIGMLSGSVRSVWKDGFYEIGVGSPHAGILEGSVVATSALYCTSR